MWEKLRSLRKTAAVATIVRAAGSTPRKEGAKMLVFADGTIRGTIGGGLCENAVIHRAAELAAQEDPVSFILIWTLMWRPETGWPAAEKWMC